MLLSAAHIKNILRRGWAEMPVGPGFARILSLLVVAQKPYCIGLLLSLCILGLNILSKGLRMLDHTLLHGLERSYTV